jgi:hypothetical protein
MPQSQPEVPVVILSRGSSCTLRVRRLYYDGSGTGDELFANETPRS